MAHKTNSQGTRTNGDTVQNKNHCKNAGADKAPKPTSKISTIFVMNGFAMAEASEMMRMLVCQSGTVIVLYMTLKQLWLLALIFIAVIVIVTFIFFRIMHVRMMLIPRTEMLLLRVLLLLLLLWVLLVLLLVLMAGLMLHMIVLTMRLATHKTEREASRTDKRDKHFV